MIDTYSLVNKDEHSMNKWLQMNRQNIPPNNDFNRHFNHNTIDVYPISYM